MAFKSCIIYMAFSVVLTTGCNRAHKAPSQKSDTENTLQIEGIIEEGEGSEVILERMAAREFIPVDTAICDNTGAFTLSFEPEKPAFYVLRTGPSGYVTLLAAPGESIRFSCQYGRNDLYTVTGSEGSEQLMHLSREHKRTLDALGRITRQNMESQSSSGYAELKLELDRQFDSLTDAFQSYSLEFIHRNRESLVILVALYNLYGEGLPVFHPENDLDIYKYVDSVLTLNYPEEEAVRLLHAQITSAEATRAEQEHLPGPVIGQIAPDFVSSRPDGGELALSELRGNYILLHFWAAWSKPSREENSYLLDVWEQFSDAPFRILQVSLDGQKEEWVEAIGKDGLGWDHVSDLRRWESAVAALYQVEKIPSNFLIGPGGRIIARDLYGDKLIEQLKFSIEHE